MLKIKLTLEQSDIAKFLHNGNETILCNLVSRKSKNLFLRFQLPSSFITMHPDSWNNMEEFTKGKTIVKNLKLVNDTAERGIKQTEKFNTHITKDEEQKQYLLQVSQFGPALPICFIIIKKIIFLCYALFRQFKSTENGFLN